ncbi:hypothetical protein A2454_01440 [Candidatus Peribacteria bacterium RIFOXYC2_FULL_55_14]|nr:MAG: hypothetical protein A2198_00555 [Candidatus Peribacteria bacterium RIFOXYA1_FULL_56_14]OGJ73389.1 MAG: hypothetical protein A2217_01620 [Candidatus Peribacteria bacterium RIFOXYA2_FULL_55_28]OGJ74571.1 MAG: hypothetical protein A2384_02910 [Candidatus Peribacteria bacterium RIFOXYB1_FULL_54_35]OGJ77617.1 MAG: hypothetical protein A2327_05260 [Candidatus Peribacteria bacterium RIFOXYB2_FULL_54_17]OGJ78732.1 MAG: hypothetical protein A2424_00400 [Candidatus Peribacteria bacterium RIFOXYC
MVRSASRHRRRMRFLFTADLCSLLEAKVPTKIPCASRGSVRGVPGSQRMSIVLPFHTVPFLITRSHTLRPRRRESFMGISIQGYGREGKWKPVQYRAFPPYPFF